MSLPDPNTLTKADQAGPVVDGKERLLALYEQMLKIRLFEEQVNKFYQSAVMPGLAHLYSGQEAVAVGVCAALRPDDARNC